MKKIIRNLEEMKLFANEVAVGLKSGDVIGLVGELGAGKTTFVQYLAKALGVKARVNSPTFLVLRIYNANTTNYYPNTANKRLRKFSIFNFQFPISKLVHIDAYRLRSARELEAMGALEYIGMPSTVTLVEWADRVENMLPKKTRWLQLGHTTNINERVLIY